jgi:Mrr N-terminal domain
MIGHDSRVTAPKIPQYHELMWPALQATKELGGSATVSEMNERAMASAGITEEQQAVLHGEDGRMSEAEYRLHWAILRIFPPLRTCHTIFLPVPLLSCQDSSRPS